MLKKSFIRDGHNRLIGSVTSGFADGSSVVRDEEGRLLGRTSDRFKTTRDNRHILSLGTPDPGLIFWSDDDD